MNTVLFNLFMIYAVFGGIAWFALTFGWAVTFDEPQVHRVFARLSLLSLIWPLAVAWAVGYGVVWVFARLVKDAFGKSSKT